MNRTKTTSIYPLYCESNAIADYFLFPDYIIVQMKEGAAILSEDTSILFDIIKKHYGNKKLVYIANRAYHYAVSPTAFLEASNIPNLVGMAIVTDKVLNRETVQLERMFYRKAFNVCDNIEDAIVWAKLIVEEYEQ